MQLSSILFIVVSPFALLLNYSSLLLLKKSLKLQKSRFEKLVILLSISEIFFLVEVITYIIVTEFDNGLDTAYKYACLSVTNLTVGTYIVFIIPMFSSLLGVSQCNICGRNNCY